MKNLILSGFVLGLTACAGGSGGSDGGSKVKGLDLSGSYSLSGVACLDASSGAVTEVGEFTNGYTASVVISGNSFTQIQSSPSCSVTIKGNLEFRDSGLMDITNQRVESATDLACSLATSLDNSNITPNSASVVYSQGQGFSDLMDIVYGRDSESGLVALLTGLEDQSGGYCFYVYQRQ